MKVLLQRAIGRLVPRRNHRTTLLERQRIVSMIDAGADYAIIQSELGVSATHIDHVLRHHVD